MHINKKALIGTLGATAIGAGIGGMKGLEKGLCVGSKIGFLAGMTAGVVATTLCVVGKNKIKRRCALNKEE